MRIAGVLRENGEQPAPKALTEDELRSLLEAVAPPWRPFVQFVAHTGMRIGEAIAVRWSDVDLDARRVYVRRRWFRGRFGPPKSAYGVRSIPLSAGMAASLEARRNGESAVGADALVWTNRDGRILDPSNLLERVFKPPPAQPVCNGPRGTPSGTPAGRCSSDTARTRSRSSTGSATTPPRSPSPSTCTC